MQLPNQYQEFLDLPPEQIQQLCDELAERPLDSDSIGTWLEDWTNLSVLFQECMARLDTATAVNTADEAARQRVAHYRETIWHIGHRMEQQLGERQQTHANLMPPILLEAEARWAESNRLNQSQSAIDLLNREAELLNRYSEIIGRQTIEWEGEAFPARRLQFVLRGADRTQHERVWRAMREREWQDRDAIGRLWSELLDIRSELAEVNGFDNYLSYRWAELGRTDYSPDDSRTLHASLLTHWAPLHSTLANRQQERLKVDSLRPWDQDVTVDEELLHPYETTAELLQKTLNVFRRMDPEFGAYVEKLRDMGFIDLAEREHTVSSGGFSRVIGRHGNFIFLNVQRTHQDVAILAHEIGHALANSTSGKQPYRALWGFPADFNETPSGVMELLTQPYWDEFYTPQDLERARRQYFQGVLRGGLSVSIFDAFQHWVYGNPEAAHDLNRCDAQWHDLWQRYQPGFDWTGIEQLNGIGWQTMSLHFYMPLHAMEYAYGNIAGLKLLTLPEDEALRRYKTAIALGNSVSSKGLFAALGVEFPFTEDDILGAAQVLSTRLDLRI